MCLALSISSLLSPRVCRPLSPSARVAHAPGTTNKRATAVPRGSIQQVELFHHFPPPTQIFSFFQHPSLHGFNRNVEDLQ
ncbi:hypothetical protein MTR_7g105710 [Medicago truncatula]|uniref:Uncharacterized protein n=1 Tax=Medicago truncatula TaxID=3880 RepID=G7ZUX0_MEDTR|nr:hypothetical protein MTR_7g105710 [Medicago truncatula]